MQLEPGERSILATFTSWTKAEDAARALNQAGLTIVQVDRWSEYGGHPDNRDFNDPVRGQQATLSGLVLHEGDEFSSRNAGPLLAADPDASGMSGPPANDRGVLLTAVVPDTRTEEAVRLIKQHDGQV